MNLEKKQCEEAQSISCQYQTKLRVLCVSYLTSFFFLQTISTQWSQTALQKTEYRKLYRPLPFFWRSEYSLTIS